METAKHGVEIIELRGDPGDLAIPLERRLCHGERFLERGGEGVEAASRRTTVGEVEELAFGKL